MSIYDTYRDQMQQDGPPLDCAPHGVPEHECLQCEIDRLEAHRREDEEERAEMQELLFAVVDAAKPGILLLGKPQVDDVWIVPPAIMHRLKAWAARYGK